MYSPSTIKVAVVKDEEKLVLVIESLNRVGNALGEIPNVTKTEFLVDETPVFIDG